MKTLTTLVLAAGVIAVQGCAAEPSTTTSDEEVVSNEAAVSAGAATLTITTSAPTMYCASVSITNGLSKPTARWQVVLNLKTSWVTSNSGVKFSSNTGVVTVTPYTYNTAIAPGATSAFSFCANAANTTIRPTLSAWNMESDAYAVCPTNSGVNPTKAALAVAMANELGRWSPENDLVAVNGWVWTVALSSTGLARCSNGCPNTKAILGQQNASISNFVDQNVFNPTTLGSDLNASLNRQKDLISNLWMNNRAALPPAHKLTLVGGPTNLGIGACGPHYIYQVDQADGTALTSAQASAMANALCFYGQGTCGGNSYIGFAQVTAGCPIGRTCVAIDPTDGDNSSTSTTTAGSAPTYPLNRVWNPTNSLLGTQCIKTSGALGTLQSKCSTSPSTCGYLYCI